MKRNNSDREYFGRRFAESEKFWSRFGGRPEPDAVILDVGCGHGALCIDMAQHGARKVVGVDIDAHRIEFARSNLRSCYPELAEKVDFLNTDLSDLAGSEQFDCVVSKDTFEHIVDLRSTMTEIKRVLKPGGLVYAGFGPLWRDFYGDHKRTGSIVPWGHLMRSEKAIVDRLNRRGGEEIASIFDLGLNKLSLSDYREIFAESGLETVFFKLNNSGHPVLRLFDLLARIPFLTEYFAHNVYCILKKRNACKRIPLSDER